MGLEHRRSAPDLRHRALDSLIYAGTVTNYSAMDTRRIDLVFGVSYDDNVVRAKEIMQTVIDADARILENPAPTVMMLERVKQALEENGLSIPYPQRDVHLPGQASG